MKRFVALLIGALVLMTCIFGGCENQPAEKSTLSVYVVKSDALYMDAVNSFKERAQDITLNVTTFQSYEAMVNVMHEELLSKGGPDVVLYNSVQGEVDAYKLAKSGMLLPLEGFVENLDPTIYPTVLMDAGKIADKQYLIPFSYNLIYAYTSEQRMAEKGYSPSDNIYKMILGESEALMDVSDKSPTTMNIFRPDPVNSLFDAAGIQFFDKNTGEVTVDKAELEEICRFVKLVYDNAEKTAALSNKIASDFADAVNSFTFFTESYDFMNNVRFYQTMIPAAAGSPMVAMPYHKLNNTQELCASIVCFGGVNANTKTPEKAYELLKYILDYNTSYDLPKYDEASYFAPVSLTGFQNAINKLSVSAGLGPGGIAPLAEENAEHLMESSQKITDAVIPNATLGLSFQEILDPYFMGKDSFDNCYNTLLNELQLYLDE